MAGGERRRMSWIRLNYLLKCQDSGLHWRSETEELLCDYGSMEVCNQILQYDSFNQSAQVGVKLLP